VGNHTTDCLVEDSGWGTEMEGTYIESDLDLELMYSAKLEGVLTSSGWVVSGHLAEVCVVLYYNQSTVSVGSTTHLCAPFAFSSSQFFAIHR